MSDSLGSVCDVLKYNLDLRGHNIHHVPSNLLVRDYVWTGDVRPPAWYKGQVQRSGEVQTITLSGVEIDPDGSAFVCVLKDGVIEVLDATRYRWFVDGSNTVFELLAGEFQDHLIVVPAEILDFGLHKVKLYSLNDNFVHQLILISDQPVGGTCRVQGEVLGISNGVNVLNKFGTLDIELALESSANVQLLAVYSSADVVYKSVVQPPGRLVKTNTSFVQRRGSNSQLVDVSNPILDTRVFYEFDAVCSSNQPPLKLEFRIENRQFQVQTRRSKDVTVTVHLIPRGSGFMPVLSEQKISLRG